MRLNVLLHYCAQEKDRKKDIRGKKKIKKEMNREEEYIRGSADKHNRKTQFTIYG